MVDLGGAAVVVVMVGGLGAAYTERGSRVLRRLAGGPPAPAGARLDRPSTRTVRGDATFRPGPTRQPFIRGALAFTAWMEIDPRWAKITKARDNRWIDRDAVVAVHVVSRPVGRRPRGGLGFETADGRYDATTFWPQSMDRALVALDEQGWPIARDEVPPWARVRQNWTGQAGRSGYADPGA